MHKTVRIAKNIHSIELEEPYRLAVLSDLHWDNPKCDWDKLKKHLDYCKAHKIPVMVNGDFFCLMQGKGDPRKNKSDIRQIHNNAKYLDSVVETAVDWFSPYAEILTVLGYGNHETSIIKHQETDILQRFVDLLNFKNHTQVQVGGYGGWINIILKSNNTRVSVKCKYFHGSGGGGIVTKGAINITRALEMYENMDVFMMGHIHENWARNDVRESFTYNSGKHVHEQSLKNIHLMITGTYKEEYGEGLYGWHIERGAPPKPLGGRILQINLERSGSSWTTYLDSIKFPL
jgi:UDP-2,3-diacylglucosamine pyrophosphatase LpxH